MRANIGGRASPPVSRNCTLSARLYYICISNCSRSRSFAKKSKTVGNFAKYGVQPQAADCHIVRPIKAFLCKKQSAVLAQKSGLRITNKAYLHCKQALFDTQIRLNCHAKKPCLHSNQGFFGKNSPFSSPENALFPAFTPLRNSWNVTSRCQNFLLHTLYLHTLGGRASPPDNNTQTIAFFIALPVGEGWVGHYIIR